MTAAGSGHAWTFKAALKAVEGLLIDDNDKTEVR